MRLSNIAGHQFNENYENDDLGGEISTAKIMLELEDIPAPSIGVANLWLEVPITLSIYGDELNNIDVHEADGRATDGGGDPVPWTDELHDFIIQTVTQKWRAGDYDEYKENTDGYRQPHRWSGIEVNHPNWRLA